MFRMGIVALACGLVGCMGTGTSANNFLAWQIRYARDLPDANARNSAMISVARSAAYVDDVDTLSTALRELRNDPRHDETAAECARFLADSGKVESARKVAKKIDDPLRKQDTLEHIAGKTGTPKPDAPVK